MLSVCKCDILLCYFLKNTFNFSSYAKKNGHPHLEHVTLPRTGAFRAILQSIGPRDDYDSPMSSSQFGVWFGFSLED